MKTKDNNKYYWLKGAVASLATAILTYVLLDVVFGIQIADDDSLYTKAKGGVISFAKKLKNKIC